MSLEISSLYEVSISGLWAPRHTISGPDGPLGVLTVERNSRGMVTAGTYRPEKGEVLYFRRDPGLLRSQFSLWTEGHEWLGSSLRWNVVRRDIQLHTGSKPLRLLPIPGFRRGWQLVAPKTGEMARVTHSLRKARIEVYRRVDFEVLVFAYFLGSFILLESLWPGPDLRNSEEMIGTATAGT